MTKAREGSPGHFLEMSRATAQWLTTLSVCSQIVVVLTKMQILGLTLNLQNQNFQWKYLVICILITSLR